jgi:hypothetical protein
MIPLDTNLVAAAGEAHVAWQGYRRMLEHAGAVMVS